MLAKAQALLFRRYTWLYLLLCFPVIDYVLRNLLPLPVISSLWDEGLLLVVTVIALWRKLETGRKLPEIGKPMAAFVTLGLAYLVFQIHDIAVSVEGFRAVYQYILALLAGFFLLEHRNDAIRVVRTLVVVAAVVGLYGIAQWVLAVDVPASWCDASEGVCRRAFSIVQSPNVLGSYMVLMTPAAAALAVKDTPRLRWLWIVSALILLAALVCTGSRGAWLAFAGTIGLLLMLVNRKLFITFLIAAVLAAVFVPQISSRFEQLFSAEYLEKSSNDGRIARWLGSYDMMRNEPLFGLGLGRYGGAVGNRHFGTTYVDSYYFKTLAETGMVGLGVYLWLMFVLFRSGFRIWRSRRGQDFFLCGGLLAGLLGVILHNAVENIFEVPFMNTYFWLMAGMLLSFPLLKGELPGAGVANPDDTAPGGGVSRDDAAPGGAADREGATNAGGAALSGVASSVPPYDPQRVSAAAIVGRPAADAALSAETAADFPRMTENDRCPDMDANFILHTRHTRLLGGAAVETRG